MLKNSLITILLSLCSFTSHAETSVWKVNSGKETVYIGGTIHLLREADYPLPEEFYIAYRNSDRIIFETDIAALSDPSEQQKMRMLMMAEPGKTADKLLKPDTLQALRSAASKRGLDLNQLMQYKTGMIVTIIQLSEIVRLGVTAQGVDSYFNKLAVQDNKLTGMLETVEEQSLLVSRMGEGNEEEYVSLSLRDIDNLESVFNEMTVSWREGNMKQLESLFVHDMKQNYPEIYQQLLVQRNNNWLPMIEAMFKQPGTEYLLVGAAHLISKDGILQRLEKKGYTVTQIIVDSP